MSLLSQAVALQRAGNRDEAETLYQSVLAADPQQVDALTLLGTIYSERGHYEEGIALMTQAIAINPNHAEAYFNRGLSQQRLGRYEEAFADYEKATLTDPTYTEAFWHKSLIHLTLGQYEKGWELYEWRWKTQQPEAIRHFKQPLWPGSTKGATLLVHAEQGFGDTLQFCRYLAFVAKDNTVVFECPESLVSLLQFNFPGIHVTSDISRAAMPEIDYHIPLLSLPRVFRTTLDTIPSAPYLKPEPVTRKKWGILLKEILNESTIKIGICWAGGRRPDLPDAMQVDARRSLRFEQMKPLLDIKNASFISLQLGPPAAQRDDDRVMDISPYLLNWSDTAAAISYLDLVISADTSVCHLAAAMGKKVFLLNRYDTCWRWLLHRDDSPWYPTLTQFRQKIPGDWAEVIESVRISVTQL